MNLAGYTGVGDISLNAIVIVVIRLDICAVGFSVCACLHAFAKVGCVQLCFLPSPADVSHLCFSTSTPTSCRHSRLQKGWQWSYSIDILHYFFCLNKFQFKQGYYAELFMMADTNLYKIKDSHYVTRILSGYCVKMQWAGFLTWGDLPPALSCREKTISPFASPLFTVKMWNLFLRNAFSFSHGVQSHKVTEVPILSVAPNPNFQSVLGIRDEFLMERMSCLLASIHLQLIYFTASAPLVKSGTLCAQQSLHPPRCKSVHSVLALGRLLQAVASGLCGCLWTHFSPLTLFSGSGLPNRNLLIPRLLVSLAAVYLLISSVRNKTLRLPLYKRRRKHL